MKRILNYFTVFELLLWFFSVIAIVCSSCLFGVVEPFKLIASLIGATSLIFNAKGNPIGQILMIVFGIMYGIISYFVRYYGEMITYVGMTVPMAAVALVSWLKNPYNGKKSEVKVSNVRIKEWVVMVVLAIIITVGFYFVLDYFNTANMFFSTVSVTTSFVAVYLTFKRSPYYALAYAANDVVLIVLWTLVALSDPAAISVLVCFSVFLVNDLYGFWSWRRMRQRQMGEASAVVCR